MSSTVPAGSQARVPPSGAGASALVLVSGVSVALADHLGWPVVAVRWAFVGAAFLGGGGILLYLWLWALTPLRTPTAYDPADGVRRRVNVPWVLAGAAPRCRDRRRRARGAAVRSGRDFAALVGRGGSPRGRPSPGSSWPTRRRRRSRRLTPTAFRIACGAFLVIVALALAVTQDAGGPGILWLWHPDHSRSPALAVLVAPWGAAAVAGADLGTHRPHQGGAASGDGRAPARLGAADPRAHPEPRGRLERGRTHRAGAGARAARLAVRGGATRRRGPRPACATARARPLEVDHAGAHRGGRRRGGRSPSGASELAAAAREAMLNAARHAGGEVSVYIEGTADAVDVFVRDRGPGFDVDAVPERPARRARVDHRAHAARRRQADGRDRAGGGHRGAL